MRKAGASNNDESVLSYTVGSVPIWVIATGFGIIVTTVLVLGWADVCHRRAVGMFGPRPGGTGTMAAVVGRRPASRMRGGQRDQLGMAINDGPEPSPLADQVRGRQTTSPNVLRSPSSRLPSFRLPDPNATWSPNYPDSTEPSGLD